MIYDMQILYGSLLACLFCLYKRIEVYSLTFFQNLIHYKRD